MVSVSAPVTIAAVQAAPIFLDRDATVAKACALIAEAAQHGARLVVFPEAFIPAYPDWAWAVAPGQTQLMAALYAELLEQSVTIPGAASDQLCAAARQAGVYVAIGVNERNVEASNTSLYNTLLFIDTQGQIVGRHRKLVLTVAERMVWAQGYGNTLAVYDTPLGRLGGLICWENYMPLARAALYTQGVELYLAPTWDRSQAWLATLQHIAREGRVYVVGCSMALRVDDIPDRLPFKQHYASDGATWINEGNSAIIHPDGHVLAGPLNKETGILYAEVDLQQLRGSRWMLDIAGHYARPDVFQLLVNTGASLEPVSQQPMQHPE